MDIRRVQGNMPPVGFSTYVSYTRHWDFIIFATSWVSEKITQTIFLLTDSFTGYFWWRLFKKVWRHSWLVSWERHFRVSVVLNVLGSIPTQTIHVFSKSHIELYWFSPSFRRLVFRSKILSHRSVQNKVNNLSHPNSKFVYQLKLISSETTGSFSRLSFPTLPSNYRWSFKVDRYLIIL